jgi:hypothetical protein
MKTKTCTVCGLNYEYDSWEFNIESEKLCWGCVSTIPLHIPDVQVKKYLLMKKERYEKV